VQGIRSLISYEGENAKELVKDFHDAVDDYLELCKRRGTEPEKAYKGTFNIRIYPDLHKEAAIYAINHKVSLNSIVEKALVGFMARA
jgi:predicted HicB family RNase H-like nuclease